MVALAGSKAPSPLGAFPSGQRERVKGFAGALINWPVMVETDVDCPEALPLKATGEPARAGEVMAQMEITSRAAGDFMSQGASICSNLSKGTLGGL